MSDDGFITITPGRNDTLRDQVSFHTVNACIPHAIADRLPGRCDWQWNGATMVRLRADENGHYKITSPTFYQRCISSGALYRVLGKKLRGRYPITRVDGNDIYIDISEPVS